MRIIPPLTRLRDRLRSALTRVVVGDRTGSGDDWRLVEATETRTRWRRENETLDCRRLGDGYVVSVARDGAQSRFQLTPGFVPLASALAVATLYLQHGVSPQFDRDGRPFVAVKRGRPRQVFDPESAGTTVRYRYLDSITTLEDLPEFLPLRQDVRSAAERMPDRRVGPPTGPAD
ncbi:MAG: hypothetical protein ABEJ43_00940 [Haloferacaceae archaeon]